MLNLPDKDKLAIYYRECQRNTKLLKYYFFYNYFLMETCMIGKCSIYLQCNQKEKQL